MKVGVLTYHGSVNPGAFWQVFATCQLLRRLGHEPIVIDYYGHRHKRSCWSPLLRLKNWRHPHWMLFSVGQKIAAHKTRRALPVSLPVFSAHDVQALNCEAILVGSDVVWSFRLTLSILGKG